MPKPTNNVLKLLKKLIRLLLPTLFAGLVLFYFWGSSGNWPEEQYTQDKVYEFTPPTQHRLDSTVRIITYNIGYLSGMTNNEAQERKLAFFQNNQLLVHVAFKRLAPHIIALQEVDYDSHRSFYVNQMEALAKTAGLNNVAQAVNWDKQYVPFPYFPPSMHFGQIISGQAILSAFPLHNHKRTALERPTSNAFYYDAFYIDRLLQTAFTTIQGQTVVLMNVHLEAYDKSVRMAQSKYVLEEYRKFAAYNPVILMGDFNSSPPTSENEANSIALFLAEESLSSAVVPASFNKIEALTFPSEKPFEQIDYIFYTKKDFESVSWRVIDEAGTASDHLPLLWEFKRKVEEEDMPL